MPGLNRLYLVGCDGFGVCVGRGGGGGGRGGGGGTEQCFSFQCSLCII